MAEQSYEIKKVQVEYKRVNAAKEEQELRIMDLMEQVRRLEVSIKISEEKEKELLAKINELQAQK